MNILCNNFIVSMFIFIFGIIFGSFLNVLIYRIPKGISIVKPASSCPKCNTRIKPYHNIPIISWILLKGKCAYCGGKISFQYPLVELISGLLALVVFKINGCNIYSLIIFFVFYLLLGLSVIDLKFKEVPDSLSLGALTLSIFAFPDVITNMKNAFIAMGFLSAIRFYVSFLKRKEAMGEADIIIGGIIGSILGVYYGFWALFVSSVIAIPFMLYYKYKKNDLELPFIPFLSLGTFIVWICVFAR